MNLESIVSQVKENITTNPKIARWIAEDLYLLSIAKGDEEVSKAIKALKNKSLEITELLGMYLEYPEIAKGMIDRIRFFAHRAEDNNIVEEVLRILRNKSHEILELLKEVYNYNPKISGFIACRLTQIAGHTRDEETLGKIINFLAMYKKHPKLMESIADFLDEAASYIKSSELIEKTMNQIANITKKYKYKRYPNVSAEIVNILKYLISPTKDYSKVKEVIKIMEKNSKRMLKLAKIYKKYPKIAEGILKGLVDIIGYTGNKMRMEKVMKILKEKSEKICKALETMHENYPEITENIAYNLTRILKHINEEKILDDIIDFLRVYSGHPKIANGIFRNLAVIADYTRNEDNIKQVIYLVKMYKNYPKVAESLSEIIAISSIFSSEYKDYKIIKEITNTLATKSEEILNSLESTYQKILNTVVKEIWDHYTPKR